MGTHAPRLRLSLLGASVLLGACQPSVVPPGPPVSSPAPAGAAAAVGSALSFGVEATDRLRGRALSSLRVDVDGVRAEQQQGGSWSVPASPAKEHVVRLARQGYLPLTYRGPLPQGARLVARLSPSGVRVVGFGDSLTAGLKVDLADRFVMRLVGRIQGARPGFWVDFLDRGRTGDTYQMAKERLGRDVLNSNPDITLVEFGTNDVFKTPLERFARDIDALLEPLGAVSPGVLVADIPYKPRWYGTWNDRAAPFNREIAAGASRHGARLVSFSSAFRSAASAGQWDLFFHEKPYDTTRPDSEEQGDLHPNAAGNALMAEAFAEAILAITAPEVALDKP